MERTTTTLRFGLRRGSTALLDERVAAALGVDLEERESLHQGGWYSRGRLPTGESIGIYPNWREHDGTWREDHHRDRDRILYVHADAADAERVRAMVRERLPEVEELFDPPARRE